MKTFAIVWAAEFVAIPAITVIAAATGISSPVDCAFWIADVMLDAFVACLFLGWLFALIIAGGINLALYWEWKREFPDNP